MRQAIVGISALLLVTTKVAPVTATPIQWSSVDGGNDHYYEAVFVNGGITWTDAMLAAQNAGGCLATLTSQEENDFVFDSLASDVSLWNLDYGPWLGGRQMLGAVEPDGGWEWLTGESWGYQNWLPGEPSNTNGQESFLQFIAADQTGIPTPFWNDFADATISHSYIIEYVPEPTTATILLFGLCTCVFRRTKT